MIDSVKVIAIPISGKTSGYKVSKLFSRSPYFLIFDEVNYNTQIIQNNFNNDQVKSGKQLSKLLVAKGVNLFCGIDIGYNVQKIANDNDIQLVLLSEKETLTGDHIIDMIKNKKK